MAGLDRRKISSPPGFVPGLGGIFKTRKKKLEWKPVTILGKVRNIVLE